MDLLHFMPEAAEHIRGITSLDEYTTQLGAMRVRAAIHDTHPAKAVYDKLDSIVYRRRYMEPEGTRSFLAAAMICRKASVPRLINKFAYIESLYANVILQAALYIQDYDMLASVSREVLHIDISLDRGIYTIPIQHYLAFATGLGRSWKLVNQMVHGGLVYIEPINLVRILRDGVTAYIRNKINNMPEPPVKVPQDIMDWCTQNIEAVYTGDTPPCVEKCQDIMNVGENLPHAGRFLLATYYINMGIQDSDIATLYQGAPDYDRKVTSYHISHIRQREYSVPSCRWVASNGLCPGCDAKHPTRYKRPKPL